MTRITLMHTDTFDRFSCSIEKEKTKCELKLAEFNVLQQQNIKVYYENQVVGDYFADIIADQVILEIKAAEGLRGENRSVDQLP